jgi:hypothetical protein
MGILSTCNPTLCQFMWRKGLFVRMNHQLARAVASDTVLVKKHTAVLHSKVHQCHRKSPPQHYTQTHVLFPLFTREPNSLRSERCSGVPDYHVATQNCLKVKVHPFPSYSLSTWHVTTHTNAWLTLCFSLAPKRTLRYEVHIFALRTTVPGSSLGCLMFIVLSSNRPISSSCSSISCCNDVLSATQNIQRRMEGW